MLAETGEGSETGSPETETSVEADTEAQRRAAFEKLIKDEYKDLYDARVQRRLDRRFRQTQALEEELGATAPILDTLRQKYGTKDIQTLAEAIEEDDRYYEQEAAGDLGRASAPCLARERGPRKGFTRAKPLGGGLERRRLPTFLPAYPSSRRLWRNGANLSSTSCSNGPGRRVPRLRAMASCPA